MNERTVATGLFVLPFLYVAALVLPMFPRSDLGVYFAFGTCVAIALILGLGGATGQLIAVVLDLLLVVLVLLALADVATFGDLASQLTAGVLVGLPFLVSALAWRERPGLAHRTVALALAITVGTALLAARVTVLDSTGVPSATSFVQAFFTSNLNQLEGLAAIAAGLGGPNLPLRAGFDANFAGLCAFAVGGVLLLALRPRTGSEEKLPIAARIEFARVRPDVDRLLPFSEPQRRAFESRSTTQPPTGAWPPGLDAIVLGSLVGCGFLGVACATPLYAPLVLAAGVVAALAAVGTISFRARALKVVGEL
jgi:hypothetical protein